MVKHISIGETLIHLTSVDSTNLYAAQLIRKEIQDGTVILADYQTQGKGQGGNQWLSEAGDNLLFSVILKPAFLKADKQYYISMAIANALTDFISTLCDNVAIKWPNDLLVNHKKIAGVLIENTIMGEYLRTTIAGIGINVNQEKFPAELPEAVSIRMVTGRYFTLQDLHRPLFGKLSEHLNLIYENRLGIVRTTYLNSLFGLNEWHQFSDAHDRFEGRITDVADSGELMVLKRNGKISSYGFREITLHRMKDR